MLYSFDELMKSLPYILSFAATGVLAIAYLIYAKLNPKDGVHENGIFDDDTEGSKPSSNSGNNPTLLSDLPYRQNRFLMKHFKIHEFDSPDEPGSGDNMHTSTLRMIDQARELAGFSFRVNSGYRTVKHNVNVGGVKGSSHTKGYAIDIHAPTKDIQKKVIAACFKAGFRRFGLYGTFIHVDNDPTKKEQTCWVKSGGDASLNPLV